MKKRKKNQKSLQINTFSMNNDESLPWKCLMRQLDITLMSSLCESLSLELKTGSPASQTGQGAYETLCNDCKASSEICVSCLLTFSHVPRVQVCLSEWVRACVCVCWGACVSLFQGPSHILESCSRGVIAIPRHTPQKDQMGGRKRKKKKTEIDQ